MLPLDSVQPSSLAKLPSGSWSSNCAPETFCIVLALWLTILFIHFRFSQTSGPRQGEPHHMILMILSSLGLESQIEVSEE